MNKAKDIFGSYIKEKGLRYTRQREAILDTFLSVDKHITVEELFNLVKKMSPDIGYATVDRNLKLMSACGLADEIKIGKQKTRYEQKIGQDHHDHLICVKCGEIYRSQG
jgi:ferric uptake regulator, Fur family